MNQSITKIKDEIVDIHKFMNKRDSTLVQDITQSIDDIVHSILTLER